MDKSYTKLVPGKVLKKKKKVPKGPVGDKKHLINPNDSGSRVTISLSYPSSDKKYLAGLGNRKQYRI